MTIRALLVLCALAGCSGSRDGQSVQVGVTIETMDRSSLAAPVLSADAAPAVAVAVADAVVDAGPAQPAEPATDAAPISTVKPTYIAGDSDGPRCKSDDDCVISCYRDSDDCCGQLCTCTRPYHRKALKALERRRDKSCNGKDSQSCPVAKCARPTANPIPRCVQSLCVTELQPID